MDPSTPVESLEASPNSSNGTHSGDLDQSRNGQIADEGKKSYFIPPPPKKKRKPKKICMLIGLKLCFSAIPLLQTF